MPDPRRYIGVRISEQGHFYIKLVAERDRINYSEALRRLLALGAKTDMEAHDGVTGTRASESGGVHQRGPDGDGRGDRDSDPGSGAVSHLPHRGPDEGSGVGDAIGALVLGGLNPAPVEEDDGPSAA